MKLKIFYILFSVILVIISVSIYFEFSNVNIPWNYKTFLEPKEYRSSSDLIQPSLNDSIQAKFNNSTRIFCVVLTTKKNLKLKARTVYDSWASKCDNHTFISMIPNQESSAERIEIKYKKQLNVLKPKNLTFDTYNKLTDKVYTAFTDIYNHHRDYDYYLKTDDDTFIFVDNLRTFLKDQNPRDPVSYGYDFNIIVKNIYHSGGAGYLLTNEAMDRLVKELNTNGSSCKNTGIEDVDVASCLRKLNVTSKKSLDYRGRERFHPLSMEDSFSNNIPDWLFSYSANSVKKVNLYFYKINCFLHFLLVRSIEG